ncbi:hypothetical protein ACPF7Z_15160 [Halomonas sp. GXIMD04776]|uniref:hypothetical protein n=1 Tax=Halomonas sp. GXIMD04776 TaxID=3415605 RepID=UPI003C969800
MNVVKKSVALIVAVASLSSVSVVLASVDYENTTGQSAQLNKIMQNLPSNEALNQDGWRNQKIDENKKNNALNMFREHNMQGQSGGMSETKPYINLNKEQANGSSDRGGAAHSPLHEQPAVGNRLDK